MLHVTFRAEQITAYLVVSVNNKSDEIVEMES